MGDILKFLNSPQFLGILWLVTMGAAFVGTFVLVLFVFPDEKQAAARRRLGVAESAERPNRVAILRWLRPFINVVVPHVASRPLDETRKLLHRKLVSANLRDELTPDEFIAFKCVLAVVVPLIVIYLSGAVSNPVPLPFWPLVMVLGYFSGDFWLSQRIAIRRRAIIRALPYTMDLLTLSVEAGLVFIAAIERLLKLSKPNALNDEFHHMMREIRLGTARSDALKSLADRLQIEEITSFTTLLVQADQLGAPVGQVLRAQADQLRSQRFQSAEAAGARASQLILFPLVLCIFPAIFIVILGPTLLNFLSKGLF